MLRVIQTTPGESKAVGKLSRGCADCIAGRKMVLFVSGICPLDCWYCTISHDRWQKDVMFANERPIRSDQDVIDEVKACGATGAGITGGEPAAFLDRVVHYIQLLKSQFGPQFHIHMYTSGWQLTEEKMKRLYEAGLDEIRIHIYKDKVELARKFAWKVGMEVPAIPGQEKQLCALTDWLDSIGADLLNLNELEFSERNNDRIMSNTGQDQKADSLTAVEQSLETAMKILKHARGKKLTVHFCTAALKLNYQLRNRLINRANTIKHDFELVTPNGFLMKGVVMADDLQAVVAKLKDMGLSEDKFALAADKKRVELSALNARRLAKSLPFKTAIVEEYPSAEPWDWELTPLNYGRGAQKADIGPAKGRGGENVVVPA